MSAAPTNPTPVEAYKYCPKCMGKFEYKGGNMLKCTQCGYLYFVNASPTAGAIIFNDKKEVLFVKRKFVPDIGTWQIPGGFMSPEETYEEALHREIEEELGVKIQVEEFVGSLPTQYLYGGVLLPLIGFYSTATITSGEITANDDVAEARFFSITELIEVELTSKAQGLLVKNHLEKQ